MACSMSSITCFQKTKQLNRLTSARKHTWHFFLPRGTNQLSCLCLPLLKPSGSCAISHQRREKRNNTTLHQVARNWSELFGFGAKIAPTMKHNTCTRDRIVFNSWQAANLADEENSPKYGKLPRGHVLDDRPRHRNGWRSQSLKTLGLKRLISVHWNQSRTASNFFLLHIFVKCLLLDLSLLYRQNGCTVQLVQKYTNCLFKSQKWCNWNTEFHTIIYFVTIKNLVQLRTGFNSSTQTYFRSGCFHTGLKKVLRVRLLAMFCHFIFYLMRKE